MQYNPSPYIPGLNVILNQAVLSPNKKLRQLSRNRAFVKCISCMTEGQKFSKQELRINYLHGVILGKIDDNRYAHLKGQNRASMPFRQTGQSNAINPNPMINQNQANNPNSQNNPFAPSTMTFGPNQANFPNQAQNNSGNRPIPLQNANPNTSNLNPNSNSNPNSNNLPSKQYQNPFLKYLPNYKPPQQQNSSAPSNINNSFGNNQIRPPTFNPFSANNSNSKPNVPNQNMSLLGSNTPTLKRQTSFGANFGADNSSSNFGGRGNAQGNTFTRAPSFGVPGDISTASQPQPNTTPPVTSANNGPPSNFAMSFGSNNGSNNQNFNSSTATNNPSFSSPFGTSSNPNTNTSSQNSGFSPFKQQQGFRSSNASTTASVSPFNTIQSNQSNGAFVQNQNQNQFPRPSSMSFSQIAQPQATNSIGGSYLGAPSSNSATLPNTGNTTATPSIQEQKVNQGLDQMTNRKQNLWNVLCLDPNFRFGTNEEGRRYVKSVLKRIIDEHLLSEERLSLVIAQIYKQVYGIQNVSKMLEDRKKQLEGQMSPNQRYRAYRANQMMEKERQQEQEQAQSIFPERLTGKSLTQQINKMLDRSSIGKRRYWEVVKPKELNIRIVERADQKQHKNQSALSETQMETIRENLTKVREQQRRKIMATEQDLPILGQFQIFPPLSQLCRFSKYDLLSVPKVRIWNKWGMLRFKAPISLVKKNISEVLKIHQKQIEIRDEEWQVRDAEITFNHFANFNDLNEEQQDDLEATIEKWAKHQKLQIVSINREDGCVVLDI